MEYIRYKYSCEGTNMEAYITLCFLKSVYEYICHISISTLSSNNIFDF